MRNALVAVDKDFALLDRFFMLAFGEAIVLVHQLGLIAGTVAAFPGIGRAHRPPPAHRIAVVDRVRIFLLTMGSAGHAAELQAASRDARETGARPLAGSKLGIQPFASSQAYVKLRRT